MEHARENGMSADLEPTRCDNEDREKRTLCNKQGQR